jgi:hypothetical protein
MTPEGWVKNDIKAWLDWLGWWYFMPVKQRFGRIGIPDFIICAGGIFLAVEAKRAGNERGATATQKEELAKVNACGGRGLVCASLETLKDYCYADESIRAQLPSRGSEGEPCPQGREARAAARTLRI